MLWPSWQTRIMQNGDIIMAEGGQNAPGVSDVAKQLAKQNLGGEGSETVSAIVERVTTEVTSGLCRRRP
jgi:hypothetical protein